jgi:hypothetical protein
MAVVQQVVSHSCSRISSGHTLLLAGYNHVRVGFPFLCPAAKSCTHANILCVGALSLAQGPLSCLSQLCLLLLLFVTGPISRHLEAVRCSLAKLGARLCTLVANRVVSPAVLGRKISAAAGEAADPDHLVLVKVGGTRVPAS